MKQMSPGEYIMTHYGRKLRVDGKVVCQTCQEKISSRSCYPWCLRCLMDVSVMADLLYKQCEKISLVALKLKCSNSKVRDLLDYISMPKHETYKKRPIEKESGLTKGKDYAQLIEEGKKPVISQLDFLKSKMKKVV